MLEVRRLGQGEFATTVKSSDPHLEFSPLRANHEEADTRLILHCIHAHMETIVVAVRDTDVLLLLLSHYDRTGYTRLYMKAGTLNAPTHFPVHEIRMLLSIDLADTLLAFHAIYGVAEVDTCNKARVKLLCIGRTQETLPSISDAATFHIMRSHYQASVWNQANLPYPDLPPVIENGWMHLDGRLVPRLLSLSSIPKICRETTHVLYEGCAIANSAAGHLATNVVTLMTTRINFM